MKRIIKDYKSITQEQLQLINQVYPDGFDEEKLMYITNASGQSFKVLQIKTDDAIYLFKFSKELMARVEDFNDELTIEEEYHGEQETVDPES